MTRRGGLLAGLARRTTVVAAAGAVLVGLTPAEAGEGVLTNPRRDEQIPAAGFSGDDVYLAWTQAPVTRPKRTHVFAQKIGGRRFRVDAGTGPAFTGGISNDRLVYQKTKGPKSNLRGFRLSTRRHFALPRGINTPRWEMRPTIWGPYLLFGRDTGRRDSIVLFNLNTHDARILARARGPRHTAVWPGQVNGDFAVYMRCPPRRGCNVFRYRISNGNTVRIPKRRKSQYSPSVALDGTVFYARSGIGCGTGVTLQRWNGRRSTRIARLGDKDLVATFATGAGEGRRLYYDRGRCDPQNEGLARRANLNVYRLKA